MNQDEFERLLAWAEEVVAHLTPTELEEVRREILDYGRRWGTGHWLMLSTERDSN